MDGLTGFKKARFYFSVSAVYALTLLFAVSIFSLHEARPDLVYTTPIKPIRLTQAIVITEGRPMRLVVPRLGLDLPVDDGVYDAANRRWTLSGYHAQFALSSVIANDYSGTTLIYGHNNWDVFGKLRLLQPGDSLQLFADNGHRFDYIYQKADDTQPDDLSVFKFSGPPTLTVQTCAGSWNEIRRMYQFSFDKVAV